MNETKTSKVGTVFFCLWVLIAILLIQTAAAAIGVIPAAASLVAETAAAGEDFFESYQAYLSDGSVLMKLQFAAEIVCIIAAGLWYYLGYVRKDKQQGTYRPIYEKYSFLKDTGFILCGCIAVWSLAAVLQRIASALMPGVSETVNEILNLSLGGGTQWMGIVTAVLLAPVCEELTVRGIILQRSKRAFGMIGCIVISAVMFGIFHMNPIQALYVLPMGLFWGFVGYKKNSVIPCIFCHILNNSLGFLLPAALSPVILFIVFGVLTAVIGMKLGYFTEEEKNDAAPEQSPAGDC